MIDVPLGKALVPVEYDIDISACPLECAMTEHIDIDMGCIFMCMRQDRKDGKNVIFKLVDYPESFYDKEQTWPK